MSTTVVTITLTDTEARSIADALLSGCLLAMETQHEAVAHSLDYASAANRFNALRDAMLLLEGRIAQPSSTTL